MPVKPAANQRGFTLIEVIIAMAVFAILAAIAVPNFNVWQRNAQVRSDARLVKGALQQARVDAITRNDSITISFVSDGWQVEDSANAVIRNGALTSGVTLTGVPLDVTFNSRGLPITSTIGVAGYGKNYIINISAAGNISL